MVHLWSAWLDSPAWPAAEALPRVERERAARILAPGRRRRWVAGRWALRGVLARHLGLPPQEIELATGAHGKPALRDGAAGLGFNLSHSGDLAMVAVAEGLEVGVDVQRLGSRPPEFYAAWTLREAVAKCHGVGIWAPRPEGAVAVADVEAGTGFAATLAIAADRVPPLRRRVLQPIQLGAR
jgi:4'-phosphopantetheinyl transferase